MEIFLVSYFGPASCSIRKNCSLKLNHISKFTTANLKGRISIQYRKMTNVFYRFALGPTENYVSGAEKFLKQRIDYVTLIISLSEGFMLLYL